MSREYETILDLIRSQVSTDNDPVFVGIGNLDAERLYVEIRHCVNESRRHCAG